MDAVTYAAMARAGLAAAGYTIEHAGDDGSFVAHRRDFKLQWMATSLNTVIVLNTAPRVTGEGLTAFADEALKWGSFVKGKYRGLQSGVGIVAVAVSGVVDDSAVQVARKEIVRDYAAFAWPVVVDLTTGQRTAHVGRPALGAVYTGWMRKQIEVAAPVPR